MENKDKKDIKTFLDEFGMSKKEQDVYLALLSFGQAGVSTIARQISLPRQTVNSILNNFQKEHIVLVSLGRGIKKFSADPALFEKKLIHKKEKICEQIENTKDILKDMIAMIPVKKTNPKVFYFDGEDGLKLMFDNILTQYKNGAEKVFRGFGVNFFKDTGLEKNIRQFVIERYKKYKVETRLILSKSDNDMFEKETKSALGRKIKYIEIAQQNSAIYLVGDILYMFSFDTNCGLRIENESFTFLFKNYFDFLWNV